MMVLGNFDLPLLFTNILINAIDHFGKGFSGEQFATLKKV